MINLRNESIIFIYIFLNFLMTTTHTYQKYVLHAKLNNFQNKNN